MAKKFLIVLALGLGSVLSAVMVHWLSQSPLARQFDGWVNYVAMQYHLWFRKQQTSGLPSLISLAFLGGLVASISPCILSLLPVNLSYIGTRDIQSRWDALSKAAAFVLGVVTILSLFGVFSSFAGFVLIKFTGYFQVAVGVLIILMGLSLANLIHLPRVPQWLSQPLTIAQGHDRPGLQAFFTGPYGVGVTFAFVSSPCTSPIMFSVLSAAAATGSQLQGAMVMVGYSLGYTAIIFFASLFAGLVKQTRGLLGHAETITRFASFALLLIGGFYLVNGGQWIAARLT
ncbi:cytochrome c biogenesis protein CcdA [Alkalinema pantanalense CENA528]|uniref:cytochrome c biogenesis protein CcdA n=1 Tax=Alkalinema pantanalense TaxID=1620705 RepID=UPI003D700D9F